MGEAAARGRVVWDTANMRMSDEELEEIRARSEAATEGPWISPFTLFVTDPEEGSLGTFTNAAGEFIIEPYYYDCPRIICLEKDAEFVAHSREDVPRLLDEIAALKEELRRIHESK